ncbi:hypothetical protein [Jiangella alkaliphila]|uniref:Uncharacterized protein n=1 Tax=Jiangella alkaliphila TaxID=419479 RepID=A0A1H2JGC1_9ACTN|nr:hypothetical protein [Jiangella alkaliphila]SDU55450.1 hypothetical protein SAMN04488563_2668 [Jiangella alkaliphila]
MTIEDELELALRAEALRLDPPVQILVDGGVARGRELRRRRRSRLAVGGAALVVAASVGGLVAAPLIGADDDPATTDDAPVASGADAAPPAAEVAEIDADAVLDAVVALLPPGEVTEASAETLEPASAWYQFRYDDGDGASWMMGSAVVAAPGWEIPECPVIVNGSSCEVQTLDDGTVLMLTAGPYYPQPDREPDRLLWSATAVAPSGLRVSLGEMNTPTEKDSEPTRDEPPLSLDQLAAVVTDGVWAELTAGVPADSAEQRAAEDAAEEAAAAEAAELEASVAAQALAASLGPDWVPTPDGFAEPGPAALEGLPSGYTAGPAIVDDLSSGLTLAELCVAGEEKGSVNEGCVADTAPGGEPVHVQWGGTVPDGPYAQESLEDRVSVLVADDAGLLLRASIWVAEPAEVSTPQRRAEARAWLEQRVDGLARAVTAAAAEQRG